MKNKASKQTPLTILLYALVAVVAVAIALFAFLPEAVKDQAESRDILSIYEQTDYDYIIYNPSADQIEGFKTASSVDKVVPFYQVVYTFQIKGKDREVTIKSVDNESDLQYTEFAQGRLVKSKEVSGKRIYLDYALIKDCDLKIGDEIGSGSLTFVVAGYYQSYDKYLAYSPDLKDAITDNLSYGGVYVKTSDVGMFTKQVLQGYKPLATLKDRDSFTDDEAYQNYLDNFNSRDYSSYIINRDAQKAEMEESHSSKIAEAKKDYLVAGILSGAIILVGVIAIALINSKNTKYEVVDGGRKKVLSRYILAGVIGAILSLITWCVGVGITAGNQSHAITLWQVLSFGWASILLPICAVAIGTIVNVLIVRGYKEHKK